MILAATVLHAQAYTTTDTNLTLGTSQTSSRTYAGSQTFPFVTPPGSPGTHLWQLDANPWGVSSGTGSASVVYSGNGTLIMTVDYAGINNNPVNGYPFIFYGGDPYGDHIAGQPPIFPAKISAMSSLVFDIAYSLSLTTTPTNLDIGFDEWIIPTNPYTGGEGNNTLEVFIAPYLVFGEGICCSFVKTIDFTTTLNGTTNSFAWDEYMDGQEVVFLPHSAQVSAGEIAFNMLPFVLEAIKTSGIGNPHWFVAGMDFGTEFGGSANVNYSVTNTKLGITQTFPLGSSFGGSAAIGGPVVIQ